MTTNEQQNPKNKDDETYENISEKQLWEILNETTTKPEKSKNNELICSRCKSSNLIFTYGRGSYVCSNCGAECHEILDESPEWNNYEDNKTDNNRCGVPINSFFPSSSLGTTINTPGYSKVKLLKNWGNIPYKERSLGEVLNDIDAKCKEHKVQKAVIDYAKILYRNTREIKHLTGVNKGQNIIVRGINRKQIISACFYYGSILQKSPRTPKEVAEIFGLDIKQVTKGCRKFQEIMKYDHVLSDVKPLHGADLLDRSNSKYSKTGPLQSLLSDIDKLNLSIEIIDKAKMIARNAERLNIASGHQAVSVAAGCLLLSYNMSEHDDELDKDVITSIFKISDVTLTKTLKELTPYRNILISDEKTNDICNNYINDKTSTIISNDNKYDTETDNNETETDLLIKKINSLTSENEEVKQIEPEILTYNENEVDESDVVRKDNVNSKIIKQEQRQQIKEQRRKERQIIKDDKIKQKLQLREQKKKLKMEIREQKKAQRLLKEPRKKGRPRKNIVVEIVST